MHCGPKNVYSWSQNVLEAKMSPSLQVFQMTAVVEAWGAWGIFPRSRFHPTAHAHGSPWRGTGWYFPTDKTGVNRLRPESLCLLFVGYFVVRVLVLKALTSTIYRNCVEAGHL